MAERRSNEPIPEAQIDSGNTSISNYSVICVRCPSILRINMIEAKDRFLAPSVPNTRLIRNQVDVGRRGGTDRTRELQAVLLQIPMKDVAFQNLRPDANLWRQPRCHDEPNNEAEGKNRKA